MNAEPLYIHIEGPPQGKARPRMTKSGHVYTPKNTVDYETQIAKAARVAMTGRTPIDGPVWMYVSAYYGIPKSWSQAKAIRAIAGDISPTVKPDSDNVLKAIADALNGIVYADDKQLVHVTIEKRYSSKPAVIVRIAPWLHDSTSPDPSNVIWRDSVAKRTRAA